MENAKRVKPVEKQSATFPEARDPDGVRNI